MAALTGLYGAETERRMALRHAVMLGTHGEQRSATRLLTTAPAVIYLDGQRHVGLVRDLSDSGLFVYSDFAPADGAQLKITVQLGHTKTKTFAFVCAGRVVRTEQAHTGAATGIAVEFERKETELPENL